MWTTLSQLATIGLPELTAGIGVGIVLRDIYEAARRGRLGRRPERQGFDGPDTAAE